MQYGKYDNEFWESCDELVKSSEIVIDRPKNSVHPKYKDFIYPVDYGYLKETKSMDGSGIDIWIGSLNDKKLDSILCTIDLLKKDSEIKFLFGCDENEKRIIYHLMNEKMMRAIMIERSCR